MIFGGDFAFKLIAVGTLVDKIGVVGTNTFHLTFAQYAFIGHVKKRELQRAAAGIQYQYFHFFIPDMFVLKIFSEKTCAPDQDFHQRACYTALCRAYFLRKTIRPLVKS
jgi:hypothetical protein